MDVILNNYSGKVKTTRRQTSNSVRTAGSQKRNRITAHDEFIWLGLHHSDGFLVGAGATGGTGNMLWGRRWLVVIPSHSSYLITVFDEPSLMELGWCRNLGIYFSGWLWLWQRKSEEGKHGRVNGQTTQGCSGKMTSNKKATIISVRIF